MGVGVGVGVEVGVGVGWGWGQGWGQGRRGTVEAPEKGQGGPLGARPHPASHRQNTPVPVQKREQGSTEKLGIAAGVTTVHGGWGDTKPGPRGVARELRPRFSPYPPPPPQTHTHTHTRSVTHLHLAKVSRAHANNQDGQRQIRGGNNGRYGALRV
jgi:hypothetical protein